MPSTVRFDCFEVDPAAGRLFKHGLRVPLREQSLQVLLALVERPGEVVTREQLRQRLWPAEVFVDYDNILNTAVARLRLALGDSSERPRLIETLPRHGYRFIGECQAAEPEPKVAGPRRTRLLVLPFLDLGGDGGDEYFSDAMTDEAITALARAAPDRLAVIARTTAMRYRNSRKDIARIGRELDLDYVVEGGVRRAGERVAFNIQIVRAGDQAHVFADTYECGLGEVFGLHRTIAGAIADRIPAAGERARDARPPTGRTKKRPTDDLIAYNLYLRGRHCLDHDTANAKQHLEQALARDPHFAAAYVALAEYYWMVGFLGFAPPKDAFAAGSWAVLRALEEDDTLAESHALLGVFRKELDYNWSEVHREMDLALSLDPASPLVRFRRATSGLMPLGRLAEAAVELETALEFDPLNLETRLWLGLMRWWQRDCERANEQARLLLGVDPDYPTGFVLVGLVRLSERRFGESVDAFRTAVGLTGGAPVWLGWLGLSLARDGKTAEARELLARLHETARRAYVPASSFAWIHLGLGEIDDAFGWMDRAVDDRDPMMVPIKSYDFFDPLRSDPRFAALLRKMNLGA